MVGASERETEGPKDFEAGEEGSGDGLLRIVPQRQEKESVPIAPRGG